jgi:hypothetical protein
VTRNATQTTAVIVAHELARAGSIVRAGGADAALWDQLTTENDAVTKFGVYLVIIASTAIEQDFMQWAGFVESRMVDVILQLERVLGSKDPVPALRPCDRKYYVQNPQRAARFLVGIDVAKDKCPELVQLLAQQLDFSAFTRGARDGMSVCVDVTTDPSNIFADHVQCMAAQKMQNGKETVIVGGFHSVRAEGVFAEKSVEENTVEVIPPATEEDQAANGIYYLFVLF